MPTPDLSPSCAGKTNRPRKRQRSYEYAIKRLIEAAWNAEATSVWITLPRMLSADPIQIADDGPGMTLRQLAAELDRFRHQHRRREKRTLILRRSIKNHVRSN